MLKRIIILLCLAGGVALGTTLPSNSHAKCPNPIYLENGPEIDEATAHQVAKKAGPQFGLTTADAISAYTKGHMSIVEVPQSGSDRLFDVTYDGESIWVIVANDI